MSTSSVNTGGRIDLNQVPVDGISGLVYAEYDYTDPSVATEFYNQISILNEIYNRTTNTPADTTPTLTATDVTNVNKALATLQNLAINGLAANSTANIVPPVVTMKQYFLTTQMASSLDLLNRTFNAVGATGSPPVLDLTQLTQWKDLSVASSTVGDVLNAATYASASNNSLQSLIELQYVQTGSQLISDQLGSLNDALTVTNNVLNSLATLQDIRNRMVVNTPTGYTLPTSAMLPATSKLHAGNILSAYRPGASTFFNQVITPTVSPDLISGGILTTQGNTIYNNLLAVQRSLLAFIPILSGLVGSAGLTDSNSLYNRIKTISGDMSALFQVKGVGAAGSLTTSADQAKALQTYLLDNNVSAFFVAGHVAGDGASDLNFGITSAQSLNDTQKQNVNQFLNVFQEYYQSASAILQAITQIIEKMAQNISR